MKKTEEVARLTEIFENYTKAQLSEAISTLDGDLGAARIRNNLSNSELNFVLIGEKKEQLKKIRSAYGSIEIGGGIELAIAELARTQGMESAAIADLENLEKTGRSERILEISIDTANKIMKQKQALKGRNQ